MTFPVRLSLNLAGDDSGIREYIRLHAPLPQTVQVVICENPRYADATFAAWMTRKMSKGLPCGGGWQERHVQAVRDTLKADLEDPRRI